MMTAVTSTVPTVYRALTTGLRDELAGDGFEGGEVLVTYGGSLSSSPWDHIVFGNTLKGENEWSYLGTGRKRRDESYLVCLAVHCRRPGGEATDALEASYGLLAGLENMIADDPSLGLAEKVSPTLVARMVGFDHALEYDEASRGWLCRLDAKVQITVRLN